MTELAMADDPIDIAHRKIQRAFEHQGTIEKYCSKHTRGKANEIVAQPDGAHPELPNPPIDIAILVGELLYQVRSSLDHLFFELVQRNQRNIVLPDKWERDCQFPIYAKLPDGVTGAPCPRDKFPSRAREWISDEAFTFIESLQPYYRSKAGDVLAVLNKLSNIDKHRHLNMVVNRFDFVESVTSPAGWQSHSIHGSIDAGTELPPTLHSSQLTADPQMKVELRSPLA